ncbi:MAG: 5-(carboxyamino)imidazole ribonucleotide synthase [Alphaproteobacteria bacterium]
MNMKHITLGILGGGQLGRMSALAAAELGIQVIIYTPEKNAPASQVSSGSIVAEYQDRAQLAEFAAKVDIITYEFENIPIETVRYLKTLKPVYPDERLLEISQDRIAEKTYLNSIEIPTARWMEIDSPEDVTATLKAWGTDRCILKTTRMGYDGKGQSLYKIGDNINDTIRKFNGQKLISEEVVDFRDELSVIIARDASGAIATYGPMLNQHKNHILDRTIYPAPFDKDISERALAKVRRLAEAVNLRGVLTIELFLTKDDKILANEIAPRTHNSGHWTIDACATSQFEQHVRCVCGLPVGSAEAHSGAEMINLIGEDAFKAYGYLGQENACLHLYGKQDIKPGRKMGHVTILGKSHT